MLQVTSESPSLIKLTRARVQLLFSHPFFASLCLRLKLVPAQVKTMETDGRAIVFNDTFVESLSPEELQGVLAHETLHCALGHHCRRGNRDEYRWNLACDYAVNPVLIENGFTLPANALIRSEFKNLSAEEIYSRLSAETGGSGGGRASQTDGGSSPEPKAEQTEDQESDDDQAKPAGDAEPTPGNGDAVSPSKSGGSARPGGFGEVRDATGENGEAASEAEFTEQQQDWAVAAEQAGRMAKACGHAPMGVSRLLQESRESKKDWRAILREFVVATAPSDYRFCPPNRRHVHAGLYLPSIHKEGVGPIVIGVDTSSSIGEEELKQFAGEISAIADQAQPEAIHVVYCDAAVHSTQEFAPSDPIVLEPKGGGGTDFRPVFKWAEQNDIQPVCLIYLTDLDCSSFPDPPRDYPVLWVTDSRARAPFGETLQIMAD